MLPTSQMWVVDLGVRGSPKGVAHSSGVGWFLRLGLVGCGCLAWRRDDRFPVMKLPGVV